MSSVRSTAAMASLPQISFCAVPATGVSARTVGERVSLAFMGVPVIRYGLGEADHSSPLVARAIEARRPRSVGRRGERSYCGEERLDRFAREIARDEHDPRAPVFARPRIERDRRVKHVLRAL